MNFTSAKTLVLQLQLVFMFSEWWNPFSSFFFFLNFVVKINPWESTIRSFTSQDANFVQNCCHSKCVNQALQYSKKCAQGVEDESREESCIERPSHYPSLTHIGLTFLICLRPCSVTQVQLIYCLHSSWHLNLILQHKKMVQGLLVTNTRSHRVFSSGKHVVTCIPM